VERRENVGEVVVLAAGSDAELIEARALDEDAGNPCGDYDD
jgi:hypothetical protein